ncbi:hypothetical protein Pmar_PMAR015722, partial [Perkinsus marinus ATCC 50983]
MPWRLVATDNGPSLGLQGEERLPPDVGQHVDFFIPSGSFMARTPMDVGSD